MIQRHILNGVEINEPNNYAQLEIELNYEKNSLKEVVTINDWVIGTGDNRTGNDGLTILRNYLAKGLTGGQGVTEGIPFQIKLDNEAGTVYTLFDGYLDLWSAKIDEDRITAPAVEQGKLDWLNQVADSVTFDYLYTVKGLIQDHHFVKIPYVINRKANGVEVIAAIIGLYVAIREIISVIQAMVATANDATLAYITIIIRLILYTIYFIALLIAIFEMFTDLYNQIIQPVKYHYGMKVQDAFRLGLEHFGLSFSSSILQRGDFGHLVWIPEKYNQKEDNTGVFEGVTGLLDGNSTDRKGFPRGTIGQFIRIWEQHFNAKILIENGVFYFEDQDFNIPKAAFVVPDVEMVGYRFNKDEFYSNITLSYATDLNDRNTIQEYLGTSVQIIQQPRTVQNKKMVLTRNLHEVNFGFALGKRKTSETFIERRILEFKDEMIKRNKVFLAIVEPITQSYEFAMKQAKKVTKVLKSLGIKVNFIGPLAVGPSSYYGLSKVMEWTYKVLNTLEGKAQEFNQSEGVSRIGMLMMENDFVMVPKAVILDINDNFRHTKVSDLNETRLNARYIWNRFHKYKSFLEEDGKHNQYLEYDLPEIAFTFSDFEKVRLSNRIFDSDMNEGKLLNLKFIPEKGTATGKFKVNTKYTDNLQIEIIEPDGK